MMSRTSLLALALVAAATAADAAPPAVPSRAGQPPGDHASAGAAAAQHPGHGDHKAEWGYTGPSGPEHWAELSADYQLCAKGQQESPIDLRGAVPALLPSLRVEWKPLPLRVVNNGHTLEVEAPAGSRLQLDGTSFRLTQFHYHHPSEHLLDGRRFPMELHFVHQAPDGTHSVIGVFVQTGRHNPTLQAVLDAAPPEPGARPVRAGKPLDPQALLPAGGYFRYEGSLTTPPCSESVRWIVMSKPIQASAAQIEAFSRIYPMNARPLQAANRRYVLHKR